MIQEYLDQVDWRVAENANIGYSSSGLMFYLAQKEIAKYCLEKIYPAKISKAHKECFIHIHNLGMGLVGYCAGWSLWELLEKGFTSVTGATSKPPKHFDTALLQMANFIGSIQNEWAGAQAFNNVDTLLAPFARKDGLDYKHIKQYIQQFIYNLNVSSRWGGQTPFTNITLDGDGDEYVRMIFKAFFENFFEGDAEGKPFTFPIPTVNITREFDWDSEDYRYLWAATAKYGTPYFTNFVNSDLKPEDIRSMCCRLRLDLRELRKNIRGGLFGSGDVTGSIGVVTLNLPRYALGCDEEGFFYNLDNYLEIAKEALEIKRKVVVENYERGLMPLTKRYLNTGFETHFSTIGVIGMHEACVNLGIENGIASDDGHRLAIKTLNFILDRIKKFQEETGHLYNLEATPAEGASYRLAKYDHKLGGYTSGKDTPFYTNSTHLPVDIDWDIDRILRHQEPLQTLYTGGTVLHIWSVAKKVEGHNILLNCNDLSPKVIIKDIVTRYRIPYLTYTPTFSICSRCGYLQGKFDTCPNCGGNTEVYSRVVGYIRPVSLWNKGKQEEFRLRRSMI